MKIIVIHIFMKLQNIVSKNIIKYPYKLFCLLNLKCTLISINQYFQKKKCRALTESPT